MTTNPQEIMETFRLKNVSVEPSLTMMLYDFNGKEGLGAGIRGTAPGCPSRVKGLNRSRGSQELQASLPAY